MTPTLQLDFHVHTRASDGAFSAREVLALAAQAGLDGVALTDHDTLDAYDALTAEDWRGAPRLLGGVEISTRLGESEAHILGYFAGGIESDARAYVESLLADRRQRLAAGITRLRERGLDVSWSDCEALATGRVVSRNHLAMALVGKGYIGRAHRAYPDYAGPAVVPLPREHALDAVRRLRGLGAITVWAHPGRDQIAAHLDTLRCAGLDGLEVHIPRRPGAERRALASRARELGLVVTGGSDWHGHPGGPQFGKFRVSGDAVGEFLERIGWR